MLQTLRLWLECTDQTTVLIEGNEDIDVAENGVQSEYQIKSRHKSISFGEVAKAILIFAEGYSHLIQQGRDFRGVFIVNNALGRKKSCPTLRRWMIARDFDPCDLEAYTQELGGLPSFRDSEIWRWICNNKKEADFLRCIVWCFNAPDCTALTREIEQKIEQHFKLPALALLALVADVTKRARNPVQSERQLNRRGLEIALTNFELDRLSRSAAVLQGQLQEGFLWISEQTSFLAVLLVVPDLLAAEKQLEDAKRSDDLGGRSFDVSRAAASLECVIYVVKRTCPGKRGQRQTLFELLRQAGYRHTIKRIATKPVLHDAVKKVFNRLRKKMSERLGKDVPDPDLLPCDNLCQLSDFSSLVGNMVIDNSAMLRELKTKLRWIYDVDRRIHLTATDFLVP
jgi:hypothetical protein